MSNTSVIHGTTVSIPQKTLVASLEPESYRVLDDGTLVFENVRDDSIVGILRFFVPRFVKELYDLKATVEARRKGLAEVRALMGTRPPKVHREADPDNVPAGKRPHAPGDEISEPSARRRKVDNSEFMTLKQTLFFSDVVTDSSSSAASSSRPKAQGGNVHLLRGEEEELRGYTEAMTRYTRLLRALAILLDSDVIRLSMVSCSALRMLTNEYAHASIDVRKLELERLIEKHAKGVFSESMLEGQKVKSRKPVYEFDPKLAQEQIGNMLDAFKEKYDAKTLLPFPKEIRAFLESEQALDKFASSSKYDQNVLETLLQTTAAGAKAVATSGKYQTN